MISPSPIVDVSHIEITSAVQIGPARITGARGSRLDFSCMGHTTFWVEVVDNDGSRLLIHDTRSYEDAILAAEENARDEGVRVIDRVCAEGEVTP